MKIWGKKMDLCDFNHAELNGTIAGGDRGERPEEVLVTLVISVSDREALWDTAAVKGLSAPGMRLADLMDVIGPREDPAIAECIALLTQPSWMAGCELEGFDVEVIAPVQVRTRACDLWAA